jgi:hypothetical protein
MKDEKNKWENSLQKLQEKHQKVKYDYIETCKDQERYSLEYRELTKSIESEMKKLHKKKTDIETSKRIVMDNHKKETNLIRMKIQEYE